MANLKRRPELFQDRLDETPKKRKKPNSQGEKTGFSANLRTQLAKAKGPSPARATTWQTGDPVPAPGIDDESPLNELPNFDKDNKWVEPPSTVRLSDLQLYMASKNLNSRELYCQCNYDFDSSGNVRSSARRPNQDPAPLIYAHGLLWIVAVKGTVALKYITYQSKSVVSFDCPAFSVVDLMKASLVFLEYISSQQSQVRNG
jgi:hypothetical protein